MDRIRETGAEIVVAADAGCVLNLRGALSRAGLPLRAIHLAEILAAGC